ncbi:MAG: hypothetical protein QG596_36 [Actinomycetota bacterium]|jgi:CBS domain-containing protein|nr:hypothetical protein [Actinomycetota bacterium]
MSKSASEIMTGGTECVGENDSVADAATRMTELNVGAMPICGEDNRLKGMLTDRDIVTAVVAKGRDPQEVMAGELRDGKPVTIGADDSIEEAIRTMKEHAVRRLPVIDGHDLVGIVSQGDIAKQVSDEATGDLIEAISTAS